MAERDLTNRELLALIIDMKGVDRAIAKAEENVRYAHSTTASAIPWFALGVALIAFGNSQQYLPLMIVGLLSIILSAIFSIGGGYNSWRHGKKRKKLESEVDEIESRLKRALEEI